MLSLNKCCRNIFIDQGLRIFFNSILFVPISDGRFGAHQRPGTLVGYFCPEPAPHQLPQNLFRTSGSGAVNYRD